jgi:tRNA(Ile)-lysidine synthase
VEDAARLGRYRALSGLATEVGASVILTGHTRSDSVETLLLHLLRGSGPRGLRGIEPVDRLDPSLVGGEASRGKKKPALRLVRPLLDVDRAETAAYCAARSIAWRVDPTNADHRFTRNRVRQHLLPVLRTYNPAIDEALDRLARTMRDDERWVAALVERSFRRLSRSAPDRVCFDLRGWQKQPLAVRRRLALRVAALHGLSEIGFEAVDRVVAVGTDDGPARTQVSAALAVERTRDRLVFRFRESCPS